MAMEQSEENLTFIKLNKKLFSEEASKHISKFVKGPINRILFINPPGMSKSDFNKELAYAKRYWCYPPYGIAMLVSELVESGFNCSILDLNYEVLKVSNEEYPGDIDYSFILNQRVSNEIAGFAPDLVCISVMFSMSEEPMKWLVDTLTDREIPVMVGGVHPTNDFKRVLDSSPNIFMLNRFEGDGVFVNNIKIINKFIQTGKQLSVNLDSIRNVVFKQNDEIHMSEALKTPSLGGNIPNYLNLPLSSYSLYGQVGSYHFLRTDESPASSLLAKRGCRAQCTFCSVRSFNGVGVRVRNVDTVIDEIKELYSKGIKHITWLDDDLLYDLSHTNELFLAITRLKYDLTWDASNGLIAAAINEENLDLMVSSGCVGFNLGIESGSAEILRSVKKPGTPNTFRKIAKLIEKHPQLFIKGFLMMGFPGETIGQMKETVDLAVELQHDWYPIQILNPLPSTEMTTSVAESGQLGEINAQRSRKGREFTAGVFSTLRLQEEEKSKSLRNIGSSGDLILHEKNKKHTTQNDGFINYFNEMDQSWLPKQENLADIWFAMDYHINYEPILNMSDRFKLEKKRSILLDITKRITKNNPLGLYFLSQVQSKLGEKYEARKSLEISEIYRKESSFWDERMTAFNL